MKIVQITYINKQKGICKMTKPSSHLIKVEILRRLYIRHCNIFGKVSEERYQGVLDGLDLTMELSQSIKTFEKDIKEYKNKIAQLYNY